MKRLIKRLRKGLNAACITAALATCWGTGQPAQGFMVNNDSIQFSGTIEPSSRNLSHVYMLYATGSSGWSWGPQLTLVSDAPAPSVTPFSYHLEPEDNGMTSWGLIAIYGDVNNGVYNESINGVTVSTEYAVEGDQWVTIFNGNEADVFGYLYNGDTAGLASWCSDNYYIFPTASGLEFTDSSPMYDFSTASQNGFVYIPEPLTVILVGAGGLIAWRRRRGE